MNTNIALPPAPKPLGAYVEAVQAGNLLFLSAALPMEGGAPKFVGRLGAELSTTTPEFRDHPKVADGAAELLAEVFGPGKTSTRSVAGVLSLPAGAPVVVEIILALS